MNCPRTTGETGRPKGHLELVKKKSREALKTKQKDSAMRVVIDEEMVGKWLGLSEEETSATTSKYGKNMGKQKKKKIGKVEFQLPDGPITLMGAPDDFQRMEKIDASKPSARNLANEVRDV